jgi:UDP-N-acetylmuramoylalanine-D-glutamate ligase
MNEAVEAAFDNTESKKICLMSCASSSFSLFKDYEEKALLYKECLKARAKTGDTSSNDKLQ